MSDDIEKEERVKRPEPEVLAADGLPIKIGDTVYLESFGRPFTVVGFDGAYLKGADGGLLRAACATHTLPDTQERTCHNLYCEGSDLGEGGFRCSRCDGEMYGDEPNYCCHCGAKVVAQ